MKYGWIGFYDGNFKLIDNLLIFGYFRKRDSTKNYCVKSFSADEVKKAKK